MSYQAALQAWDGMDRHQKIHIVMGMFPGLLAVIGILSPMQATSLVVIAYWMFRLRSWKVNKTKEVDEEKRKEREKMEEEAALAALPAKKRKNILKGKAKREATAASSQDPKEEEDD